MNRDNNTIFEENVLTECMALGPLDGRYRKIGQKLSPYFSEYALVKNRVKVEVKWLEFLLISIRDSSQILKSFNN